VVNRIFELEDGRITEFTGNYTNYLQEKEEQAKKQSAKIQGRRSAA
jgi:ATPase subunit of ABC transporter with duplicated ATPase domains